MKNYWWCHKAQFQTTLLGCDLGKSSHFDIRGTIPATNQHSTRPHLIIATFHSKLLTRTGLFSSRIYVINSTLWCHNVVTHTHTSQGQVLAVPVSLFINDVCEISITGRSEVVELRQADISFQRFKRLLKTFLFRCWDCSALWLTVKAAPHKFSYLLTYWRLHAQIQSRDDRQTNMTWNWKRNIIL